MGFLDRLFGGKKQGSQPDEQTRRDLAESRIESFTNSIGTTLKRIPAGSFVRGSSNGPREKPPHKVAIARPFYIGVCPVTQAEWKRVMGDNPSDFKGANMPVEKVSWKMAQDFCRKLSEKEGLPYRLPTEAQWEYACRAGTTTEYCFGDSDDRLLGEYAWFDGNSGGHTHDVGQKKPNAWGLFDMHGNVWEWCEDVWHANYDGAPADGSAWVEGGDEGVRLLRGGSWVNLPRACGSAARLTNVPRDEWSDYGLRVCLRDF